MAVRLLSYLTITYYFTHLTSFNLLSSMNMIENAWFFLTANKKRLSDYGLYIAKQCEMNRINKYLVKLLG